MKKPIISFILLCFSLSLIGQTKIGFYNKSHGDTIKFSVIDTLLYVESANKNVLLLNIPVRIHGRNFVILKSSRKQFSDAVKKHFGKDTLSDKTEPVLRYKDGTKEICHNEVIIKLRKPAKLEDILREYQYTYTQDSFMSNTYYVRFKGKDPTRPRLQRGCI